MIEHSSPVWLIAIAVLFTLGTALIIAALINLTKKVQENTQAMEENLRALQTFAHQDRQKSLITIHQLVQHSEFMPDILARFESSKTPEAVISTLSHDQRLRLRSFAIEVLLNLETMIYQYLNDTDREENALFQIKAVIRQRYALWQALGSFEEANLRPDVRRFIQEHAREDRWSRK